MSDGYLYKFNATSSSKSVCKKFDSTTMTDGQVRHSDNVTYYRNYPEPEIYEQYFNATWSGVYKRNGVKMPVETYGKHPRAGSSADFVGMWGFDRNSLRNFVGGGIVQDIQIQVYYDWEDDIGQMPAIIFFPHIYTSEPATYDGFNANESHKTLVTFDNSLYYDYASWIKLPYPAWLNGQMGGIACAGWTTQDRDYARFAGVTSGFNLNAYNTRLFLQVLK